MIAYVLSNTDLKIKDVLQFEEFSISRDIELSEKSEIIVAKQPNVVNDDFVILKDDFGKTVLTGICESVSTGEEEGYTIYLKQPEQFFSRQILLGDDSVIASEGIEDFIKNEIYENWIASGDALLDKTYISVSASTHTPIPARASTIGSVEDGVYNLKTFIGNALERYGIHLRFTFGAAEDIIDSAGRPIANEDRLALVIPSKGVTNSLFIDIYKDDSETADLATGISDVVGIDETYEVDVLAKLTVKWMNTITMQESVENFYLKADRTITTNADDQDRASGVVKAVYVEAESRDEMLEKVKEEFQNNSYAHKITLNLLKGSRAYPHAAYYVGRKTRIKTKTGVQETLVTAVSESSEAAFVNLIFGKLKVTLLEKLRK